jgi:predicted DNA-binding transcriptional regulator YafY
VSDVGPLARALVTLELIQNQPGVTAEHLGRRLGVSERAARRYVAVLREAGIPIDSTRGPYGGYRVGRGVRLPPLTFSAAEALALVMAVLDGHHDTGDPTNAVGAAISKILRALPEAVAAEADIVRRSTSPAPDRAAARPNPEITATLVQASAARRRVRIGYRSEGGNEWSTDLEPWAVVVRHARWYLLCHDDGVGDRRAYRVDRVQHVDVLDDAFTPPANLDAVGALEAHLSQGWEHEVEVVIDASTDIAARWVSPSIGQLRTLPDGRSLLIGTTSNLSWYAEQLALIRAPYRIIRSPELQNAATEIGRRLVDAATAPEVAAAVTDSA